MKQLDSSIIQEKAISEPSIPGLPSAGNTDRTIQHVEFRGSIFESVRQLKEAQKDTFKTDNGVTITVEEAETKVQFSEGKAYSITSDGPGSIEEVDSSREVEDIPTLEEINNELEKAVDSLAE